VDTIAQALSGRPTEPPLMLLELCVPVFFAGLPLPVGTLVAVTAEVAERLIHQRRATFRGLTFRCQERKP
jgi:hypothetical protein